MTNLTICIPTYNFGEFIGDTLNSIVYQAGEDVEILVVDGASTDNTAQVVKAYTDNHNNVRYELLDKKGGIDIDIAKAMDMATGEFCWLFSSDDLMCDNAIKTVLGQLDTRLDLLLCTHINCTLNMTQLGMHPVLDLSQNKDFNFDSLNDINLYFSSAVTTEAFFSFMSGLIINRETWHSVPPNTQFIGSCWAHAARLFQINAEKGLKLRYLHEPLVLRRGGNDSFAHNGLVKRFAIAIEGYNKIASEYFGESSARTAHIRRALRNEYSLKSFLYAKYLCYMNPELESMVHLNTLVEKFYCEAIPSHIAKKLIYRSTTFPLLSIVMNMYSLLKNRSA